jgi:transcriptional regulator with XRE-family HTH domain
LSGVNEQLRAARERTASPAAPDECLSRQELAELANEWIWKHHKKMAALSANYIGQLERGYIHWPGKLYREALRAILGVSTDAALGFVNTRRAVVKLEDVKRKQFIQTATA